VKEYYYRASYSCSVCKYGVDEMISGKDIVAGFYKHDNYSSGSIQGREFLDQVGDLTICS
jgi:hypothetical protein